MCFLAGSGTAVALVLFEQPTVVTHYGNVEALTPIGDVATDGAGIWITAASSSATPVLRRSIDGGRTWSEPYFMHPDVQGVVTQFAATPEAWVAVSSFHDVQASQSVDGGLTWSQPVTLPDGTGAVYDLVTNGAGTWIAAAVRSEDVPPATVQAARSIDGGQSWTTVDIGIADTTATRDRPQLATDRDGNWVMVWHDDVAGLSRTVFSASTDDGVTWSPAAPLEPAPSATASQLYPDIICDGPGQWAVVWIDDEARTIMLSRSVDGVAWSAGESIRQRGPMLEVIPYNRHLAFGSEGNGRWIVAWTTNSLGMIGSDNDVVFTRTLDAGDNWLPVATMNPDAITDVGLTVALAPRNDYISDVVGDSTGTWIGQYAESDHCCASDTVYMVRSVPDCPTMPPSGCQQPSHAGAASIRFHSDALFRDFLTWTWVGDGNQGAALGDPVTSTEFAFCLYDGISAVDQLVFEREARPGLQCAGKPCWRHTRRGFQYRDANGSLGATRQVSVQSDARKTKLTWKASGPSLLPPLMPLANDPAVRAVLINMESGACWESSFSHPTNNDEGGFRARSD